MISNLSAFTARIGGTNADRLLITVIDAAGNESAATAVASQTSDDVRIEIDGPVEGTEVEGNTVLVFGTLHAPSDTGLAINGRPVALFGTAPARSFAIDVALENGENTLTLAARRPGGARIERTLHVRRTGDSPFSVLVEPGSAAAPVTVSFTLEQHVPAAISHVDADFDSDGRPETSSFDEVKTFAHTYDEPGIHMARFRMHTVDGNVWTHTVPVTVHRAEDLDSDVQAIWSGFLSALAQQDTGRALAHVHAGSMDRYESAFDALRDDLPEILSSFSQPVALKLGHAVAEYVVTRTVDGVERAFLVYFVKGSDGVWRIATM